MLVTPPITPLEVEVTDLVFGATTIHQKARPTKLEITFLEDGGCQVRLAMQPRRYAAQAGGGFGPALPAAVSNPPPVLVIGDQTCAVDPNGKPCYRLVTATSARNLVTGEVEAFAAGQGWLDYLEAKPEPLFLQDKFFGLLCARLDVNVSDLVLSYMAQADAAPSSFAA